MSGERKYPDCGVTWESPDHGTLVCDRSEAHNWNSRRSKHHLAGEVRFVQSNSGRFRYYDPEVDSPEAKAARKPPRPQEPEYYTEADYQTWLRL